MTSRAGLILPILTLAMLPAWTAQASVLRFEQPAYEVPEGTTSFTATIVYDLDAGVVGDNAFDLTVNVDPNPGTGTIAITSAARSTNYLYGPAVSNGGVFNTPSFEFKLDFGVLMVNQGSNAPITDMNLQAGTYRYADVVFAISGPVGSVFNLVFSNAQLNDEDVMSRPLTTQDARISIVPEPSALVLLSLAGLAAMLRRRTAIG